MRNKTKSGQRGICVWVAYLVMRNESSGQGKYIENGEKLVRRWRGQESICLNQRKVKGIQIERDRK